MNNIKEMSAEAAINRKCDAVRFDKYVGRSRDIGVSFLDGSELSVFGG